MTVETTFIKDLLVLTPTIFEDERGYFFESYSEASFATNGLNIPFIQDNQSFSKKGVIRGLHFQKAPYAQAKLVRVLQGEILDVAVDLRKDSATYGQHFSIQLSAENKKQVLIPKGFAHGFSVLSANAIVSYKVDEVYHKESESGIQYDDCTLVINWQVIAAEVIVSDKDRVLGAFKDLK
jgi:dTDP-4-dehydrorhamnose 3,5-epimerase